MDFFTLGYFIFQTVVLFFVLGVLWRTKGWDMHTNTAASILTIVGVLGTFIGIYIGLQKFNPKDLQGSIEILLEGLKIAFGTSIVGIGSALFLKGIMSPIVQTYQKKEAQDPIKEAIDRFINALKNVETSGENNLSLKLEALTTTIKSDHKTTYKVLSGMRDDFTTAQDNILTQLETLTDAVSDKNDLIVDTQKNETARICKTLNEMQSELMDKQNKSFIQLRTLTKTISYEHNQLRKEFDNFSKNVAESITELATKELISALTKVIEQFNTQLSTQFGDNFKQLNAAVGKTVVWQEQYRQQMDELADEFQIAAKSIDASRDSLITIADKSDSIVTSAVKLEPILHTLNDQLGAFSNLKDKADNAFPIIKQNLDDLTTEFSNAVQATITSIDGQSKGLDIQFQKFKNVIDGLDNFTNQIDQITTNILNMVNGIQATITTQNQAVGNFMNSVATMESTLNTQLTKSIETLGTNLASLSEKFVEDYTPLTDSLRQVLAIADGILPKQPGN